jgi:hypothetical protein
MAMLATSPGLRYMGASSPLTTKKRNSFPYFASEVVASEGVGNMVDPFLRRQAALILPRHLRPPAAFLLRRQAALILPHRHRPLAAFQKGPRK